MQCQEPKKGQQKVLILKKTTMLCPSRSYYSLDLAHPWPFVYNQGTRGGGGVNAHAANEIFWMSSKCRRRRRC